MNMVELIEEAIERGASDIHITVGSEPVFRINGKLEKFGEKVLEQADTEVLMKQLASEEHLEELEKVGQIDLSYSQSGLGRFRVNIFKQRGSYSIALRIIPLDIPSMEELGLPPVMRRLSMLPRGLILVTGPTGSGKSTTLAAMVDLINRHKNCHIITLEDPIEYLHHHNMSIINQREVNSDTNSFADALRAALRQDPDVILVGEMRDLETISTALTAAETGHLVLSTLHTLGSAKTIDRVIDVFPGEQQHQIRTQLSSVLEAVISQQLMIRADGKGRVAAFEVMVGVPAIRNLIRENKIHQIDTIIETSSSEGMQTMDRSLANLYKRGLISKETALKQAIVPDVLRRYLNEERMTSGFQI